MMSRAHCLSILVTTFSISCANAEATCGQDDPDCFTHPQTSGSDADGSGVTNDDPNSTSETTTGNGNTTNTNTVGNTNTTSNANTVSNSNTTANSNTTENANTTGNSNTTSNSNTTTTTITKTLVVDSFSSVSAFNASQNSLSPPQIQSDNQTMSIYSLATSNRMELQCNSSGCFWYSLLAAQGSCLDITSYTHIALTVQGPAGADASFQLQNNSADCTSTTFTGSQNVDLASYVTFDNNPHSIRIPLSAFPQVDKVHSRAIAVLNMAPGYPIYFSNIQLITVAQSH